MFYSCSKSTTNNNALSGKWNIVTDAKFIGLGQDNQQVNYVGKLDDYFDFLNDSVIYMKEGSVLDTLNYKRTSNTTIIISSFGVIANGEPETSQMSNHTNRGLTITAANIYTPGGTFGRKIVLSR